MNIFITLQPEQPRNEIGDRPCQCCSSWRRNLHPSTDCGLAGSNRAISRRREFPLREIPRFLRLGKDKLFIIIQCFSNSDNPFTKMVIARVDAVPQGVQTPSPLDLFPDVMGGREPTHCALAFWGQRRGPSESWEDDILSPFQKNLYASTIPTTRGPRR